MPSSRAIGFLGIGLTALGLALVDYSTRRIHGNHTNHAF